MGKTLFVIALISLVSVFAFAFDLSFYNSFETLCMGETFTGIANDANSLYYNPAGLANGSGWTLKLPNADVDMSSGIASATVKALTHIDEIKAVLNSNDNLKISTYFLNNYLKALVGESDNAVVKSSSYLGYEGKNFALMLSAIGQAYANSFISSDLVPFITLHAKAAAYAQLSGALAFNVSKAKLSVGGTYRYGYVMPAIYSIDNLSSLMVNSSTFDPNLDYEATSNVDLGVKISLKGFIFGGLWHDLLNSQTPDVRVGIGYVTKKFSIGLDFEKLFNGEYSIFRRIHVGTKYTPWNFLNLYAGLSAGWFSGGVKLNLGFLSLYAGTYVLNNGYHAGWGDDTRMYTVGLGL